MPFALVIIGLLCIVTGAKDTYRQFGAELVEDFTGPGNFTWWIMGMGAVGAIGYYKPLQSASRLFLVLILLGMLLSNQGFFAKLTGAVQAGPVDPETPEQGKVTPADKTETGSMFDIGSWGPGNKPQAPTAPQAPKTIGDVVDIAKFVSGFFI